ncbi:hypothetical protein FIE12Z_12745 [Fusarium flagelliforme]|uniref:C2H2-type domain-containing protein n=1 Tax=Fusarium flagelliforme TaxID=2675880 RepID=A0A395M584_9HYPO|nr:hypothetical protein FIE12Z_12745 [Fusarium flagelliforme]
MESPQKRKLEEELNPQCTSPEQSPKKKTAIMYPCADHRCAKSFVQKDGMERHLRDVHKDKYCFGCNKHFDKFSIGHHLLQVHQGISQRGKFRCSRCPGKKVFKKEQDLMDHVRWKHNGCAACGIFFKYHHSCSEHVYDVHHVCRGCGERFRGPESLEFHWENSDKLLCWIRRPPARPVTATAPATELGQQATTDLTDDLPELLANNSRFGEYRSWCGECQEQFGNECEYKLHFETSPNHFICVVCEDEHHPLGRYWRGKIKPRDHESQEALDEHRTSHHVRCEPCDIWLYGQKALSERQERRHFSIICKPCDKAFPNKRSLKKCPYLGCKEKFSRMSLLFQHLENRECSLRGWEDRTSLKERLLEPLEEAILAPLRCTKCDEYFGVNGRDEHIRDEHDSLFCFICNRHFSSRKELGLHIRYYIQYHGQGPEDRRCESCTKGPRLYKGEGKFYDHMWTAHNSCAVCARNFDTKEDLIEHDKEVHFKCHVCSDISEDASALKRHFREHHLKFSTNATST